MHESGWPASTGTVSSAAAWSPAAWTISRWWFTHLVAYLADLEANHGGGHWCYWAINGSQSEAPGRDPRQPDYYGIFTPDWSEVASRPLMEKLADIL